LEVGSRKKSIKTYVAEAILHRSVGVVTDHFVMDLISRDVGAFCRRLPCESDCLGGDGGDVEVVDGAGDETHTWGGTETGGQRFVIFALGCFFQILLVY